MRTALDPWLPALLRARCLAWLLVLAAGAALALPVRAHLMVAQKGTLNFSGDGAYLLMSLPVSSLTGVDDDGDGLLSSAELQAHATAVEHQVADGVQLLADGTPLRLNGLMLNLSAPGHAPGAPASQLVVMGRFAVGAAGQPMVFSVSLFGASAAERAYDITFTRRPAAHAAHLTPSQNTHSVFPSASMVFGEQLRAGFGHVLTGLDHLLFLLLVLGEMVTARRGWKQVGLALSCFTLGHGVTLVASAAGWLRIGPAVVEPAIAATIVAMAWVQRWQARRGRWITNNLQLGLVFGCALLHGLGLASGMRSLGLDGWDLASALAGFNAGIEGAQVLVAALAASALLAARRAGIDSVPLAGKAAPWLAAGVGSLWFFERAAGWA